MEVHYSQELHYEKILENLQLTKIAQVHALLDLLYPLIKKSTIKSIKAYHPYKIALVANMSAGKTSLINTWFGDDILPSLSCATTDCPVYIYSDNDISNNHAHIIFEDGSSLSLVAEEVKHELKHYASKDSMNNDKKYMGVKEIHLHWDFMYLQNQKNVFNFIIIDTPGINNTDKYAHKHLKSTQKVIAESDMVLMVLDYGQLDACLEITKGGVLEMLKKRKGEDSNFEVFFIINKIDLALSDNASLDEVAHAQTAEKFYEKLKEYWFFHENRAIKKVEAFAKNNNFENACILSTSSFFVKLFLLKNEAMSFDEEDNLDNLKKQFKRIFGDIWERALQEYIESISIDDKSVFNLEMIEKNIVRKMMSKIAVELRANEKAFKKKKK